MPWIFDSPPLSVASQVVISAVLLCISNGWNVNPAALGGNAGPPPPSLGASATGETAVVHSLTMILNDGAIKKTVKIRDGADEAEVQVFITVFLHRNICS